MRAKFSYSLEKDFQNYQNAYLDFKYPDYGRGKLDIGSVIWPSMEREILQAPQKEKEIMVRKCLNDFLSVEEELIDYQLKALEGYWSSKEGRFIERMEKYFGGRFNLPEYDVYLTTLGIYPYNWHENWFMVGLLESLPRQNGTLCHELMHLYFLNNFQIYLAQNGMTEKDILNINEAITILLNFEFSKYMVIPQFDQKPSTKPLVDEIIRLYKDNKEFPYILERVIQVQKDQ